MGYRLIIYTSKDSYEEIWGYSKLPGFEGLDETSLQDIVAFTNMFSSYDELIDFLLDTKLITEEVSNGDLGIIHLRENNIPLLMSYGVSFSRDAYLFDADNLIKKYFEMADDIKFVNAFLKKYYKRFVNNKYADLSYLKYCSEMYERTKRKSSFINRKFANVISALINDAEALKLGKRFSRIREFAMFVINFERENDPNRPLENNNIRRCPRKINHDKEKIKLLINHYQSLLDNNDLTDEQREMYETELRDLQSQLEFERKAFSPQPERKKRANGNKDWC